MSKIGDEHFAIEFELEPPAREDGTDDSLLGRMRFIVGGSPIGNFEDRVSLNIGTVAVAELLKNRGRRNEPTLMKRSTEDLFSTIFCALSEDRGQSDAEVASDWARYSPLYGIARGFEVFDDWDAFLVEDTTRARYVWRRAGKESRVHEYALLPDQFDRVLDAFLVTFRQIAPNIVK